MVLRSRIIDIEVDMVKEPQLDVEDGLAISIVIIEKRSETKLTFDLQAFCYFLCAYELLVLLRKTIDVEVDVNSEPIIDLSGGFVVSHHGSGSNN